MTVIGEHMFATGDDNGVVKGMLYLYHFLFFFILSNPLYLSMGCSRSSRAAYIYIKKNGRLCECYNNKQRSKIFSLCKWRWMPYNI